MQRLFKYGNIQKTFTIPDKELNILIYGTPSIRHTEVRTF